MNYLWVCVCVGGGNVFAGRYMASKLSLSADSIDNSEVTPFIERHRTSKSILKKSESSNNYYSNIHTGDSDTVKLIGSDNSTANPMALCDDVNLVLMGNAFTNAYGMRVN